MLEPHGRDDCDDMTTNDSELWLFFEQEVRVNGRPVELRLREVRCDVPMEQKMMCLLRTSVDQATPEVSEWSPAASVTPAADSLAAVGVRLSGQGVARLLDVVHWTLAWDAADGALAATSAFATSADADEGLIRCPVMCEEEEVASLAYRFLLIRDTLADPHVQPPSDPSWLNQLNADEVLLTGHRGMGVDNAEYPENTIAAFQAAHALGADMIELDVQLSRDSLQVIHHDLFIPRDGVTVNVCDLTLSELQSLLPHLAQLGEVLSVVDRRLAIDVEVKYSNRMVNGRMETGEDYEAALTPAPDGSTTLTRRWSKNRLADSVLATLTPEAGARRLLLSTFQPDMALALARKMAPGLRRRLPVVQLTRGEGYCNFGERNHADPRNRTVDAAVAWARAIGLDGVAPHTASAMLRDRPHERFDKGRMAALLWGADLNSVEVLRRLQDQHWASALIFDAVDTLLPQVKK